MKFKSLAMSGMIAALYVVLTTAFAPISYGPVQCRVAEALTLLPFYIPEAVPGLFIGCVIANFIGGFGLLDVVVGGSATLLAAYWTRKMPNPVLAALPPILVNAFFIGVMLYYLIGEIPLWAGVLYVGLGQAAACLLLGIPLARMLEKRGLLHRRSNK